MNTHPDPPGPPGLWMAGLAIAALAVPTYLS